MIIDLHTQVWATIDQLGPEAAEKLRLKMGVQKPEPEEPTEDGE